MNRLVTLPDPSPRTMLSPVQRYTAAHRLRSVARWSRLGAAAALALATLVSPVSSYAQPLDRGGWFDPAPSGPADPAPAPYDAAADAPTVPGAGQPAPAAEPSAEDTDPSALTTFRPALDPYGNWVTHATYGTVWVPHSSVVGTDFAPYVTRGRWELTEDDDWIWVSDYPFGWAVFHYGRWVWVSGTGWAWVPGRTYANAWVVWRVPTSGYAYVGWAPMPPSWGWFNGYAVSLHYGPPIPYVFCPSAYVFHRHVHRHIVHDRHLVHRIAGRTRVYPTPYRAPANPTRHTTALPRVRPAPAPSAAPRGPQLTAARVPANVIPARRTAPPRDAARLASPRMVETAPPRARTGSMAPRAVAPDRARAASAPVNNEIVRRSVTSPAPADAAPERSPARARPTPEPRSPSPARVRAEPRNIEPRSVAPVRIRPSSSRDLAPASRRMRRP